MLWLLHICPPKGGALVCSPMQELPSIPIYSEKNAILLRATPTDSHVPLSTSWRDTSEVKSACHSSRESKQTSRWPTITPAPGTHTQRHKDKQTHCTISAPFLIFFHFMSNKIHCIMTAHLLIASTQDFLIVKLTVNKSLVV